MSAPDFTHGYLRVPLGVWLSLYCRAPLTRRQLQLVSVVLRESWGWRSPDTGVRLWTRPLTPSQFSRATGLSTDHLRRDLECLVSRGVFLRDGDRYQLQAAPGLWISPVRPAKTTARRAATGDEAAAGAARMALRASVAKKARKRDRKAAPPLPTTGDKSRSTRPHRIACAGPPGERQLLLLISLFTGPLSAGPQTLLRQWIRERGVEATWRELAPLLRHDPARLRRALDGESGIPTAKHERSSEKGAVHA
jgi:hypothetical protein